MQRPKKLRKSGIMLQAYINQPLEFFKQAQESYKRPHLLDDSIFKRSQARTSLATSSKKHNYFISSQELNQLNTIPFKNNAITQKIIDSILVDKVSDNEANQDFFNKTIQGLRPLFKIKKRRTYPKKQQRQEFEESQKTESVGNVTITQSLRKSPIKTPIQTSFHKSYKTSLQRKKIRYKQRLQNNPEDLQFDVLINRIQNTALLGKYALKHRKLNQAEHS